MNLVKPQHMEENIYLWRERGKIKTQNLQ